MVEQLSAKLSAKVLEELPLEMQSMEERLLKRLVANLNSSLLPTIKEHTREVARGYEVIVNMVDILEKRLKKIEYFLLPDDPDQDHHFSPPTPDQPPAPPAPHHPPSPHQVPKSSPTHSPIYSPSHFPPSQPSSPIHSSPPITPSHTIPTSPIIPEPSPIQPYQITPQPPPTLPHQFEYPLTYARKGKAQVLPPTDFPSFNLFADDKKGESSATQGQAVEAATILASILSEAQETQIEPESPLYQEILSQTLPEIHALAEEIKRSPEREEVEIEDLTLEEDEPPATIPSDPAVVIEPQEEDMSLAMVVYEEPQPISVDEFLAICRQVKEFIQYLEETHAERQARRPLPEEKEEPKEESQV